MDTDGLAGGGFDSGCEEARGSLEAFECLREPLLRCSGMGISRTINEELALDFAGLKSPLAAFSSVVGALWNGNQTGLKKKLLTCAAQG